MTIPRSEAIRARSCKPSRITKPHLPYPFYTLNIKKKEEKKRKKPASLISFSASCPPSSLSKRYPAGFVYFYSALYYLTDQGSNIRIAQYVFAGIYLSSLAVILAIFKRCQSVSSIINAFFSLFQILNGDPAWGLHVQCWDLYEWIRGTIDPTLCARALSHLQTITLHLCPSTL